MSGFGVEGCSGLILFVMYNLFWIVSGFYGLGSGAMGHRTFPEGSEQVGLMTWFHGVVAFSGFKAS